MVHDDAPHGIDATTTTIVSVESGPELYPDLHSNSRALLADLHLD